MALSTDIKERIFAAADSLHAASETGEFPSIEAVRQESRAGMNNVVTAMKEWRQNQRKQIQAVREPLPADLNSALLSMGQSVWDTAQALANESLDAVRQAFEAEKDDLTQLSAEQSEAYEGIAIELEKAHERSARLERELAEAKTMIEGQTGVINQERDNLREAKEAQRLAEQRAEEIERRVADLRAELDRCHAEADKERSKAQQRQEQAEAALHAVKNEAAKALHAAQSETAAAQAALTKATDKAEDQRKQAEAEARRIAEQLTKAQSERDDATKAAAEAREHAAGLAGQLKAMQEQNAALLIAIKPQAPKAKKTPAAKD